MLDPTFFCWLPSTVTFDDFQAAQNSALGKPGTRHQAMEDPCQAGGADGADRLTAKTAQMAVSRVHPAMFVPGECKHANHPWLAHTPRFHGNDPGEGPSSDRRFKNDQ